MTSEPSVARRRGDVRRVPSEPIARRVAGRSGTNGAVPDETEDHDATTPAIEDGRRGRRARTVDGEKRDAVVPLVMPEGRRRGLSVPKASDVLADSLRQRILSGELPTGSALPVERELAATTRLSRTAVREALRILEIEGLIEIRPGRSGGSFGYSALRSTRLRPRTTTYQPTA
jgi:DNA-binding transcriptional ArsR family regulator